MRESLQLRVPTPCHEDWNKMRPEEKGRHCEHCCKTVVDFTEMSDAEVIRYLSKAGPHVCGRLMPDQIGRRLAPTPAQQNGRSGWAWVLASLMMLTKGSDDRRPVKAATQEVTPQGAGEQVFAKVGWSMPRVAEDSIAPKFFPPTFMGDVVVVKPGTKEEVTRIVPDTDKAVEMGVPVMVEADSIRPPGDTMSGVLPETRVGQELTGMLGGVVVGVKVTRLTDILADTVKQIVADTLAALDWRPAPDLNIYPNPVPRGGTLQLAWTAQPGSYQLTLMDSRGQLIAERMREVVGKGQVDSWEIPARLAAGIYILRVVRAGGSGGAAGSATAAGPVAVCTREVMVR